MTEKQTAAVEERRFYFDPHTGEMFYKVPNPDGDIYDGLHPCWLLNELRSKAPKTELPPIKILPGHVGEDGRLSPDCAAALREIGDKKKIDAQAVSEWLNSNKPKVAATFDGKGFFRHAVYLVRDEEILLVFDRDEPNSVGSA